MTLTIDPEFQHLITPLSADEFAQLEANIKAEGCRDPLVVWDSTIIDGHNRYAICTKHGIPFQTVERQFASYDEAKIWIIHNQFGRRNLSAYTRSVLALRLKSMLEDQARARMLAGKALDPVQNSAQGKTRDQLAAIASVSHDTIAKVTFIEEHAPAELKAQLHTGEVSINAAYSELNRPLANHQLLFQSTDNGWYTPRAYIDAVHAVMGRIDLDPASCEDANAIVRAMRYYTEEDDGLRPPWIACRVFLNPPYGRDEDNESNQERWSQKLIEEYTCGNIAEAILLVNAVTDRKWFQPLYQFPICFTDHRIRFYNSPYAVRIGPS
jgi:hypothetical protein